MAMPRTGIAWPWRIHAVAIVLFWGPDSKEEAHEGPIDSTG